MSTQAKKNSARYGSQIKVLVFGLVVSGFLLATNGCRRSDVYPSRPITIVCPWSPGGGTDRVSRQLAVLLERELEVPVSVINATGGKGVTGHNRGLHARPDGYTLTMMTFELNTMHWMGLTDLSYRDCVPVMSVNEDYAALLLRSDAEWKDLGQLESEIRQKPGTLTASGTAAGGAWHLALAGWLLEAGLAVEDVTWVPSAGASPSLQQLMSGGVDMVCCSLPEARSLIESGDVRALGVMSSTPAVGFEAVATFPSQGRAWTLGGWRGLGVPLGTPESRVETLAKAMQRIVSRPDEEGSFASFMRTQKFDNTWRSSRDFAAFLAANDEKLGALLQDPAMSSLTQDRFHPMTYPTILGALLGALLTFAALRSFVVARRKHGQTHADQEQISGLVGARFRASLGIGTSTREEWMRGGANFVAVLAAIVLYVVFAESVGFLVLTSLLLAFLLIWFGTHPMQSFVIVMAFVPAIYVLFAYLLRVPLPRGWLG